MDVLGVPSQTWFPVITLIVGVVLKGFLDSFADRRAAKREEDARHAQRRDNLRLQRDEFQRATLLELQEAVAELARFTGRAHHLDVMAFRKSGAWQKQILPKDVDEGLLKAQTTTNRLRVRIRDEETRKLGQTFASCCVSVSLAKSEQDADAAILHMSSVLEELHDQIGLVLRQLDDDDQLFQKG